MRSLKSAVMLAAVAGILGGCAGGNLGSQSSALPGGVSSQAQHAHKFLSVLDGLRVRPAGIQRLRGLFVKTQPGMKTHPPKAGLYAANFYYTTPYYNNTGMWQIQGYVNPNNTNLAPECQVPGIAVNGMATDTASNLMIPGFRGTSTNTYGQSGTFVYSKSCGVFEGWASDTQGQPADAASLSATSGNIVEGEIINNTTGTGTVVVCTESLSGGACGTALSAPDITGLGAGVATDAAGDCWMSGNGTSGPVLEYWAGCTGTGVLATGWPNADYGGITFDKAGNLVDIDASGNLYVLSGCNPACTLLGGPFAMIGQSFFGNLDHAGTQLAVGDVTNNQVDVYTYCDKIKKKESKSCLGITFLYSFNNGMSNPGSTAGGGVGNAVETGIFAKSNTQ